MGVHVLEHSEIENVFLSEGVLRAVADHLRLTDEFRQLLDRAKDIVLEKMVQDRESLVSSITAAKLEQRLKRFDAKARGKAGLGATLASLTSSIDVDNIYDETAAEVDRIIDERDYEQALRIYNNKGLLGRIEVLFRLARKGMPDLIKRLASAKEGESSAVLAALREQLPKLKV